MTSVKPNQTAKDRTGAAVALEVMQAEGVDVVFGYPGGAILPLYDALHDSSLRHILCRHEQGAALAANGYARATGKVGVCIATSGPGVTNLLTGLADGLLDSVPMVALTGQVATASMGTDAFQEVDARVDHAGRQAWLYCRKAGGPALHHARSLSHRSVGSSWPRGC